MYFLPNTLEYHRLNCLLLSCFQQSLQWSVVLPNIFGPGNSIKLKRNLRIKVNHFNKDLVRAIRQFYLYLKIMESIIIKRGRSSSRQVLKERK